MSNVVPLPDKKNKENALDALNRLVGKDLEQVNAELIERLKNPVSLIPELAGHLVHAGGKRIRPMLTLACAKLCGYGGHRHVGLASCVELLHSATLLHDDVVDESRFRRGKYSANALWGNKASVLVGDYLLSRAFALMVKDGSLRVLEILSNAASVIAEGEVMQLSACNNVTTDESTYLDVIRCKTAELFAAACQVGAVVAEDTSEHEKALQTYGLNLGIAFQLVDDVLDYSAKQENLGKAIGDDFREGKVTLPVILAYRRADSAERAFFARTMADMEQDDKGRDMEQAIAIMNKYNCLEDATKRARHYANIATDSLGIFEKCEMRTTLEDVAGFCVSRVY